MLDSHTGSGLPSITQITFSCMLCSLPRWIGLVFDGCCFGALPRRVLPRPHWPSRNDRPVGIHIFPFEACSSYHSRYGLQSCSPTLRGLCHEAPVRPVTQPNRSSATKAYRQLLGWVLPPLVICALEAHGRFAIFVFFRRGELGDFRGYRLKRPCRAKVAKIAKKTEDLDYEGNGGRWGWLGRPWGWDRARGHR
jgi:hypothetical protein